MILSEQKLNKQGKNIALTYSFPNFKPAYCHMFDSNFTSIDVSQETGKEFWSPYHFKNFYIFLSSSLSLFLFLVSV